MQKILKNIYIWTTQVVVVIVHPWRLQFPWKKGQITVFLIGRLKNSLGRPKSGTGTCAINIDKERSLFFKWKNCSVTAAAVSGHYLWHFPPHLCVHNGRLLHQCLIIIFVFRSSIYTPNCTKCQMPEIAISCIHCFSKSSQLWCNMYVYCESV